jgi:hypothetical protein
MSVQSMVDEALDEWLAGKQGGPVDGTFSPDPPLTPTELPNRDPERDRLHSLLDDYLDVVSRPEVETLLVLLETRVNSAARQTGT